MSHHAGNHAAWGAALALATLLAAGSAAAEGYDKTFQNEFMGNCITGGGMYTVCQCTLLQIQSQIKFETFAEMQKAVKAGGKADQGTLDLYEKTIKDCVERDR